MCIDILMSLRSNLIYKIHYNALSRYIRMPAPQLPTWQDCHELWSKKRKRLLREQQESVAAKLPPLLPFPNKGGPNKDDLSDVGG